MKTGVAISAGLHVAALAWGLLSLSSPKPLDVSYSEALPVEIIMSDAFEGVKGEAEAKITETPAPTPTTRPETLPMAAENVGDNETDLDTPPTPEKTRNQTPQTGAPKPVARPEVKPTPEPVETAAAEAPPPAPTPEPQPEASPEPPAAETPPETAPEIDPLAEAIAAAEAEPLPTETPQPDPVPRNVPVPQVKPRPPAPVKVAEAKPETPKPPKKATPKPSEIKPDTAEEDAPDSDVDFEAMAADAINKQKAAGGGAKRSTQEASLGSKKTTGLKLSQSELGAMQQLIKDKMRDCWSVNAGAAEPGELRVSISMRLNPAGELEGRPEIVDGGNGSFAARTAAEGARRAVIQCAPYNLPADKYEAWAQVTLNFDPAEMF